MSGPNEKKSSIFGQDISHEVSRKYSTLFEQDTKGSFQKPRELDRMRALGVISPTEVPTEFVNSVVGRSVHEHDKKPQGYIG